jgi:hypothetical protein
MRAAICLALSLSVAAMPVVASASSYNSANFERSTGISDMGWSYGGQTNLQQRRAIINEIKGWCASERMRDKARCTNALQVIRAGYAELQLRRQAQQAVAD